MTRKLTKMHFLLALASTCVITSPMFALSMTPFQMREDYGTEPLSDCVLQYYYYIPCPTYSWFWGFQGPIHYEIIGVFFEIGDVSMFTGSACDPTQCHELKQIRILDFAGYGAVYPGLNTVQFDVYCSDEHGCPVGSSLWSTEYDCSFGWNYVSVEPPLCLTSCWTDPGPPAVAPRILVTAMCIGSQCIEPAWGFDAVSIAWDVGCEMHDISCLPALYPRPYTSHYSTIHSGYYGVDFQYCPPIWFTDSRDTTRDGSEYGYMELAWRIYLSCTGPTGSEPSSWGGIKAMYR